MGAASEYPASGHLTRPHTADTVIEAWAPSASGCYEEAVAAFVELFADTTVSPAGVTTRVDVGPGGLEDLLVLLLEEVLFAAEAHGHVPALSRVDLQDDRLAVTFTSVPIEEVDIVGSIPKGVSYHDLRFAPANGGWRCRATVDV